MPGAPPNANDSFTQQALAKAASFQSRLRSIFSTVAWSVTVEAPSTPNHLARVAYANLVLRQLDNELRVILPTFVMRPNLMAQETSYDFTAEHVITAASDSDLSTQLLNDWDAMAAAAGVSAPPGPAQILTAPPP